jgi:hypothetical protein
MDNSAEIEVLEMRLASLVSNEMEHVSLSTIGKGLAKGLFTDVVVCAGAGLSTSAGII